MVDKITTPPSQKDVIDKVNELVDAKQDTLVSGTNLKTINNMSLLGSGNITISTGGTYTAGDGIDITNGVISVDNTIALKSEIPTNNNQLTNGAGYITGITSSDVTTALGYTPYNSTNPSGYQANVIETVKVNGTALTPSSKAVDITVPTITDTYSATSSDGMSGKAVASAISGKADSSALSDYVAKSGGSAQQTISLTSGTGTTPLGVKSMSNSSYISFSGSSGWLASFGINSSKKPVVYDGSSHTIAYTTDIPTNNNQLTNGAGYITSSALSDYVPTTRTVNSKALSADITLTASDVGALPSTTVIPTVNNATLTITQGGVSKGTFTANASSNTTIALDAGAEADNSTISLNASNKLQTIGVINQRDNSALKIWQGTEAQWESGAPVPWYNWRTTPIASVSSSTLPTSGSGYWKYPLFGNGNFVAIRDGTLVASYSTDNGATWQSSTLPGSRTSWGKPAFGGGNFVVTAYNGGRHAYSTDGGITWQSSNYYSYNNFQAIVYGNGNFVAVSSTDKAIYSTDGGITWQSSTIEQLSTGSWYAIAFGNNTFVALSNSTKAAYSTDGGVTWQSSDLPSNHYWNKIAYGNGVFLALSYDGTSKAIYSTDNGVTWHETEMSVETNWRGVAYGDGVWVASAYYNNNKIVIYSTDNGITWSEPINVNSYGDVLFDNGIFIVSSVGNSDKISYSIDSGRTWQDITLASSKNWYVGGSNNKFVAVNSTGTSSQKFSIDFSQCYTDTDTPTTSSTVYSEPETASALTVSSITSGAITLSDNNTYYYNSSGTAYTYQSVGVAYPDWLCFINGVGVKIGTTVIATYNGV